MDGKASKSSTKPIGSPNGSGKPTENLAKVVSGKPAGSGNPAMVSKPLDSKTTARVSKPPEVIAKASDSPKEVIPPSASNTPESSKKTPKSLKAQSKILKKPEVAAIELKSINNNGKVKRKRVRKKKKKALQGNKSGNVENGMNVQISSNGNGSNQAERNGVKFNESKMGQQKHVKGEKNEGLDDVADDKEDTEKIQIKEKTSESENGQGVLEKDGKSDGPDVVGEKKEIVRKRNRYSQFEKRKKNKTDGMIFLCNGKTKLDCFRYNVMGVPIGKKDIVMGIKRGMKLFLFDFDLKLLYGVFKATSRGDVTLEPEAFGGDFPAQVRFEVHKDCLPLPEATFKKAIKENYNDNNKFKKELTFLQVKKLMALFRPAEVHTSVATIHSPLAAKTQDRGTASWAKEVETTQDKGAEALGKEATTTQDKVTTAWGKEATTTQDMGAVARGKEAVRTQDKGIAARGKETAMTRDKGTVARGKETESRGKGTKTVERELHTRSRNGISYSRWDEKARDSHRGESRSRRPLSRERAREPRREASPQSLFLTEKEYRAYGLRGERRNLNPPPPARIHNSPPPPLVDSYMRDYERDRMFRHSDILPRDPVPTHRETGRADPLYPSDRDYHRRAYGLGERRELTSLAPSALDPYASDPYYSRYFGASSLDVYLPPPRREDIHSGSSSYTTRGRREDYLLDTDPLRRRDEADSFRRREEADSLRRREESDSFRRREEADILRRREEADDSLRRREDTDSLRRREIKDLDRLYSTYGSDNSYLSYNRMYQPRHEDAGLPASSSRYLSGRPYLCR